MRSLQGHFEEIRGKRRGKPLRYNLLSLRDSLSAVFRWETSKPSSLQYFWEYA